VIRQRKPIKRSRMKPRSTWLARGTKKIPKSTVRPKAKKQRTAAEERVQFAREYGPPGFLAWIHALPSVASGRGPCEAAHLGTGGTGRKGDWDTIVPLTRHEHRHELHQRGLSFVETKYGISLAHKLAETRAAWQARQEAIGG
jgi:hypothetical protein